MGPELTLGAEEELHLADLESRRLSARAPQLLSRLPAEYYTAEIQRTTVEITTDVVSSLGGLRDELFRRRKTLIDVAYAEGLGPAAVATAPLSDFADFELTTTGRYRRMQEQYRMLVDEQLICGTQIHVGVSDRDLAVRIGQRITRDLPILLALSASSPFWSGVDTGYSSIRSIIWQRWPSAGSPGPLESARDYDNLVDDLIRSGVIADAKMVYFDVRPSSHVPTLELRVCDACPIIDDAVLIAGLFRAMVAAAADDIAAGRPAIPLRTPVHRAGMWQAARNGLTGDLLDGSLGPRPIPAAQAVRMLIGRLRPQLEELGDWAEVSELAEQTLARGNSADRQRAAFAERGSLEDVVDLVLAETRGPTSGIPSDSAAVRGYRARAGDEAISAAARPRPAYRALLEHHLALGPAEVSARQEARDRWISAEGLNFRVGGNEQDFRVDLMPRVVSAHEWAALEAGLVQRARAIEAFLQDVYASGRIIDAGVVPAEAVYSSPGWSDEARRLPEGTVRAPIMGFDLVRDEFGGWLVLEDNVRSPSGIAYSIAVREMIDAVMPDAPRPEGLLNPADALTLLRDTLLAHVGPDGTAAVLTTGPGSAAWYEHRRLAEGAGLLLLQADDLDVTGGRVVAGDQVIDTLYLRLDVELTDLVNRSGRRIGEEVFDVAAAGKVFLANAPGNGVADDKASYCHVPDLIGFYLGERPLLESVPTYRPSDPAERRIVLERVGELVTKPVDGQGGNGVLIGPVAPASTILERRAAIADDPAAWIAQEVVTLSSHPTYSHQGLEPRHVDLRAFVFVTGTGPADATLGGVALTRVAPPGSMVVNSSQGGGAKDTWIVCPDRTQQKGAH